MENKTTYRILAGVGAGLLLIPLARYIMRRMQGEKNEETPVVNHLFAAYRGKHKPHHRKADQNGHAGH